jgi:hypothetical protein
METSRVSFFKAQVISMKSKLDEFTVGTIGKPCSVAAIFRMLDTMDGCPKCPAARVINRKPMPRTSKAKRQ